MGFSSTILEYYALGIYQDADLVLFVSVGFITQAQADAAKAAKQQTQPA